MVELEELSGVEQLKLRHIDAALAFLARIRAERCIRGGHNPFEQVAFYLLGYIQGARAIADIFSDLYNRYLTSTLGCTEIWSNLSTVCSRLHTETLLKIRN